MFESLFFARQQSIPIAQLFPDDEHLDKLVPANTAPCPHDTWRSQEGRAAVGGTTLHAAACEDAGVGVYFVDFWFRGFVLESAQASARVVLGDYPSVAAAE